MSDADWRAAQRRYAANPGDQSAREQLIRARERAGLPVGHLIERPVLPAFVLTATLRLRVSIEQVNGGLLEVGETTPDQPLNVPAHRRVYVRPVPNRLTPQLVEEVQRLELPGLSLERARLQPGDLRGLEGLSHLRWLSLRSCSGLSASGLTILAKHVPNLEVLDLSGCKWVPPSALGQLQQLEQLRSLGLENQAWDDADLVGLTALTQLRELSLRAAERLQGEGLEHLGPLQRLTRLDLSQCVKLSGKRFQALPTFPELTALALVRCSNLTNPALPALERQASLRSLGLGSCKFTVPGLRGCDRLRQLRELRVHEATAYRSTTYDPKTYRKLTDELFDWLPELEQFESLTLEHLSPWITDAGIARLTDCEHLTELSITDCFGISAAAVRDLSTRCPALVVRYASHGETFTTGLSDDTTVEPSDSSAGVTDSMVAGQLLGLLRLKDMNRIATAEGRPAGHRSKKAAQEALADLPLERLLRLSDVADLKKLCHRLKIRTVWHDRAEEVVERILAARQRWGDG